MANKRLSIGDRVRCYKVSDGKKLVGKSGVVINVRRDYSVVCVEFFDDIGGHDGQSRARAGVMGHCWWVSPKNLRKGRFTRKSKAQNITDFMLKMEMIGV